MLRGIAARLSANVAAADARCDASRSMRAQRNRSSSCFETRVRSFESAEALELRAPQDEDEQRGRTVFTFQTAVLVAAARFLRPGFALPLHAPPEGVGGAPRVVRVLARHPLGLHVTRQARRLTRRLASLGGRSPPGAPPWRFWAPVPRFPHRNCFRIGHSELLASGS